MFWQFVFSPDEVECLMWLIELMWLADFKTSGESSHTNLSGQLKEHRHNINFPF